MIVISDNACVNSSIFYATDTDIASVQYFGESHLATLVWRGCKEITAAAVEVGK